MSKKPLSRKKELELLRKQVKELKMKLGGKLKLMKNDNVVLSKELLKNMSVTQLRRLIVDNKLFQGISKMRKISLISEIMKTPYYKSRSQIKPTSKRPTIKGELLNDSL